MRYRRRTFIPMVYREVEIGHLQWVGEAMEAWTAEGELVGRYPTRREAASALWVATTRQRIEIEAVLASA